MKAAKVPENAPYPSTLKIPNAGEIGICSISELDDREQIRELAKKGKIDLSNKSNRAVALYNQVKEEDNPVIMLVYLKQKK
jgi:serine/threonine protein phosphatase PrpC